MKVLQFDELESADLIVDATNEGKKSGQLAGEPIQKYCLVLGIRVGS